MKKLVNLFFVLVLTSILFGACKTYETCPAYGSVDAEQTEKSV